MSSQHADDDLLRAHESPETPTPPAPSFNHESPADESGMTEVVNQLQSMFPTLDSETIADVLAGERGNAESCVPLLLMLSGQEEEARSVVNSEHYQNQLSADEAIARQLAAEESFSSTGTRGPNYSNLPYQPRQRNRQLADDTRPQARHPPAGSQTPGEEDKDELDQVLDSVKSGFQSAQKIGLNFFNKIQNRVKELNQPAAFVDENNGGTPDQRATLHSDPSSGQTPVNSAIPPTSKRIAPPLPHQQRYSKEQRDPAQIPIQPIFDAKQCPANSDISTKEAVPTASVPKEDAKKETDNVPAQKVLHVNNGSYRRQDDSDDDSLEGEYQRNPFEERD